jgi:hypothetical protein
MVETRVENSIVSNGLHKIDRYIIQTNIVSKVVRKRNIMKARVPK